VAWLVGWELRLWWRRLSGRASGAGRRGLFIGLFLVVAVFLHLLGLGAVKLVMRLPDDLPPGLVLPLATGAAVVLWTLLTAQALSGATRSFFDAGALDLLFSSPVPPHTVLAVRGLVLAITTTAPFAVFVLPIANMGLLVAGPAWLALYPGLVAIGLVGTATGLVLALGLVQVLGARITRSAGQIVAVIIGTGLGFAVQAFNRLPVEEKVGFLRRLTENAAAPSEAERLLWLPGRALLGEPWAVAMLVIAGALVFACTLRLAAARFADGRAAAAAVADTGKRTARAPRRTRFGTSPAASLRRKEWMLLVRDPWVLMPVAQRAFALVPLCLALAGLDRSGDLALAVSGPMIVIFAGKLASGIAWLTLAAEDAPELMATAPVSMAAVTRAKVEAALMASAALFSVPLALLAWTDLRVASLAMAGSMVATVSVTLLALAEPSRVRRRDFKDRFRNFGPFAVAELASTGAWAATTWLAVQGSWMATAGAALATMLLVAALVKMMQATSPGPKARRKPAPLPASHAVSSRPS
jgi:ABC-2 type transport system permease protein